MNHSGCSALVSSTSRGEIDRFTKEFDRFKEQFDRGVAIQSGATLEVVLKMLGAYLCLST